jgi:(p)ppGpp synthase/HD superfamily hydrolase
MKPTLVDRAISYATLAHLGHRRKHPIEGHELPSITHSIEVMKKVWSWGAGDELTMAGAVLHDVIEKSLLFAEGLADLGADLLGLVYEMSQGPFGTKEEYLAGFARPEKSVTALVIKLADLLVNYADFLRLDPSYARKYLGKAAVLGTALNLRADDIGNRYGTSVIAAVWRAWHGAESGLLLAHAG